MHKEHTIFLFSCGKSKIVPCSKPGRVAITGVSCGSGLNEIWIWFKGKANPLPMALV